MQEIRQSEELDKLTLMPNHLSTKTKKLGASGSCRLTVWQFY